MHYSVTYTELEISISHERMHHQCSTGYTRKLYECLNVRQSSIFPVTRLKKNNKIKKTLSQIKCQGNNMDESKIIMLNKEPSLKPIQYMLQLIRHPGKGKTTVPESWRSVVTMGRHMGKGD